MKFSDLISLEINCATVSSHNACLLIIGSGAPGASSAAGLADQLAAAWSFKPGGGSVRPNLVGRVLFGLPVLTLPYPILVHSLMTEHNTRFTQLSLFGWIEDNAILEPRAEIFGLTPLGDDPVLFLRDLDLDRAPECYLMEQPNRWLRVAGVAIARSSHAAGPTALTADDGALSALEVSLPADAQPFPAALRAEVAAGKPLRSALRAHRKGTDPAIMALCDGWRVLSRAARFVLVGAGQAETAQAARLFRLDTPRKW